MKIELSLVLTGELEDKIAETRETGIEDIVFGEGFAGVSDLEVGPDGNLYVVSLGQGKIFKIVLADGDAFSPSHPAQETTSAEEDEQAAQEQEPIVEEQEEQEEQEQQQEEDTNEEDADEEGD